MKNFLIIFALIIGILTGWFFHAKYTYKTVNKLPLTQRVERPFDKYSIESLSKKEVSPVKIKIEKSLETNEDFSSHLFTMSFDPKLEGKQKKKVSGLINIPGKDGPFPIIVMLRGYADQKNYITGTGTKKAGEYFAKNGYITIAPDFLGYAESDPQAENIFESRFQTYTTALTLLSSLPSVENWDNENAFLWGHSNGGQIALTVLEITGQNYPTVLWAPVSKPFPYSVLYYTDESEDLGKLIRSELAKFEEIYDPNLYSIHTYYNQIKAPLQIHQGTTDNAVPADWTKELVTTLKKENIDAKLFLHNNSDHNLRGSWNKVIEENVSFYSSHLKKKD